MPTTNCFVTVFPGTVFLFIGNEFFVMDFDEEGIPLIGSYFVGAYLSARDGIVWNGKRMVLKDVIVYDPHTKELLDNFMSHYDLKKAALQTQD